MNDREVRTKFEGGELRDPVHSSPVDQERMSPSKAISKLLLYLYLLRFPIITLLLIWPGLSAGFKTPLLRGLADLHGGDLVPLIWGAGVASFAAVLATLAAVIAGNLALIYGELRVNGNPETPPGNPNPPQRLLVFIPAVAVYLLLMRRLWSFNAGQPRFQSGRFFLGLVGGLLVGVTVVFLSNWLVFRLADSRGAERGAFLAIPFDLILPWTTRVVIEDTERSGLFARAYQKSPPALWQAVSDFVEEIFKILGVGYVARNRKGKVFVLPGHMFALALVLISLAVYLITGTVEYFMLENASPETAAPESVPTLAWVLAAFAIICWILSGVAFYFDRYRVPTLLAVCLGLALLSKMGPTDHFFDVQTVQPDSQAKLPRPHDILYDQRFQHKVILISAAGGGIQSAAWTAEVLSGLQAGNVDAVSSKNLFDDKVAAITAVSGGSVGTVFYLRTLQGFPQQPPIPRQESFSRAKESGLEAVAWGLIFPDFQRIALPPLFPWSSLDRGWALERTIRDHAGLSDVKMSELGPGLPAVMLNATLTEEALPLVFSNMRFPDLENDPLVPPGTSDAAARNAAGVHGFRDDCVNYDVLLETAARMSATFPWVSPAARPRVGNGHDCTLDHLVDGGYYDNFGLATLNAWLREALGKHVFEPEFHFHSPDDPGFDIILIRIIAFPDDQPNLPPDQPWTYQLDVPLTTIYNVRSEGQVLRNDAQFWTLENVLRSKGATFTTVDFQYKPSNGICNAQSPPLSWHLTPSEIQCLQDVWDDPNLQSKRKRVHDFLLSH